jgi:hypothetical protein
MAAGLLMTEIKKGKTDAAERSRHFTQLCEYETSE